MYVIRSTVEVPEYYEEYFYDETVGIKNGIGLVVHDHVLQALTGGYNQYEYMGEIQSDKELNKILNKFDKNIRDDTMSLEVRKKVLTMEDIIEAEKPKEKPEPTFWIERIENQDG